MTTESASFPGTACGRRNVNRVLKSFAKAFNSLHAEFRSNVAELQLAVERMRQLAPKLLALENVREDELKLYSMEQIQQLAARVLVELNDQYNSAANSIGKMNNSFAEFDAVQHEFMKQSIALQWNASNAVSNGDAHRKPLMYYVEESAIILSKFRAMFSNLGTLAEKVNVRDAESIDSLKSATEMPEELKFQADMYCVHTSELFK